MSGPPRLPRTIRCVEVCKGQNFPLNTRRFHDPRKSVSRNAAALPPSINRVMFLLQGGRQSAGSFTEISSPDRKYVVNHLHDHPYILDYLSKQGRIEKQVTPMFRQLTLLDMKGQRKPSTPSNWRQEFIERVKAARIVSGMKPVEVAAALRVSLDTYVRWESRALLPHHLLMPFCRITGADPVMLLTGAPFDLGKALSRV